MVSGAKGPLELNGISGLLVSGTVFGHSGLLVLRGCWSFDAVGLSGMLDF
jgi:hypothetical protein